MAEVAGTCPFFCPVIFPVTQRHLSTGTGISVDKGGMASYTESAGSLDSQTSRTNEIPAPDPSAAALRPAGGSTIVNPLFSNLQKACTSIERPRCRTCLCRLFASAAGRISSSSGRNLRPLGPAVCAQCRNRSAYLSKNS